MPTALPLPSGVRVTTYRPYNFDQTELEEDSPMRTRTLLSALSGLAFFFSSAAAPVAINVSDFSLTDNAAWAKKDKSEKKEKKLKKEKKSEKDEKAEKSKKSKKHGKSDDDHGEAKGVGKAKGMKKGQDDGKGKKRGYSN
jgi:hypothetical protein